MRMAYLVGLDEAGYGPNLGPLVVAGTLWRVPDAMLTDDLYHYLPGVRPPGTREQQSAAGLVIGDSKALYRPGSGLGSLELGVFAALHALSARSSADPVPRTWRQLLLRCDGSCAGSLDQLPWHREYDGPVPVDASAEQVRAAQSVFSEALRAADVELLSVAARVVFPAAFNIRIAQCGGKGCALSLWTLELCEQLLHPVAEGPILVQCDKHGGRNRYAALLQHVFPEYLIEVREESRQRSVYRWGAPTRRVEASFAVGGERYLPSALASMFAKYLRELTMLAFNVFWQQQVPGLRPTAGYPVDARRFRDAIAAVQIRLGIDDALLWRDR